MLELLAAETVAPVDAGRSRTKIDKQGTMTPRQNFVNQILLVILGFAGGSLSAFLAMLAVMT